MKLAILQARSLVATTEAAPGYAKGNDIGDSLAKRLLAVSRADAEPTLGAAQCVVQGGPLYAIWEDAATARFCPIVAITRWHFLRHNEKWAS